MRLALPDAGTAAEGTAARQAYDLISEGFGPGFNGRLAAVVTGGSAEATTRAATEAATAIQATKEVLAVTPPQLNTAGTTALLSVIPATAPPTRPPRLSSTTSAPRSRRAATCP